MLAGLLLGPSVLAWIDPDPATQVGAAIGVVAALGIFFLVLAAGMEVGRDGLRQAVQEGTAVIAAVEFVFPFALGYLLGHSLGFAPLPSLFLATGMAVTALPVSVRILMDLKLLATRLGRGIVSVAVANDVTAFALLAVLLALGVAGADALEGAVLGIVKVLLFVAFLFTLGSMLRWKDHTGRPYVAALSARLRTPDAAFALVVLLALGMGAVAELLGIHFAIGVFYAGIFLTREAVGERHFALVRNTTQGVGLGFLAPVFFAYVGLRVSLPAVDWVLVAVVTGVAFAGKVIGGAIGGYVAGFRGRELGALGVGLNARGMMELLLAEVGLRAGFIDTSLFAAIVFMALITTLTAPVLLKVLARDIAR